MMARYDLSNRVLRMFFCENLICSAKDMLGVAPSVDDRPRMGGFNRLVSVPTKRTLFNKRTQQTKSYQTNPIIETFSTIDIPVCVKMPDSSVPFEQQSASNSGMFGFLRLE